MSTILEDLREGDHFNIITFSDKVHTWKKGRTVRATRQNVRDAKDFVKRIIAEGCESIIAFLTPGPLFFVCCLPSNVPPFFVSGTNINAALLSAAQLISPSSSSSSNHLSSRRVPLVIFLTDGEATIGVTAGDTILSNAKKALGSASLFGLAFGDDADFLLLKRLALDNRGVARMVYEDTDAALQLKGFYDEVASPLLSDIQLSYLDDQAFDITRSLFPNYFQGSELVVTGKVKPGVKDLKVSMSAIDSKKEVKFENDVLASHIKGNGSADSIDCSAGLEGISSFVHRLWAYFTIKELLLAKLNTTDPATQRLLADKATDLSLKYNFVTPFTSLVVVKPDAAEAAQTPTTTAATITTTATTTATTKISVAGAGKKPNSPSNRRLNKGKPNPPQPPPTKKSTTKTPSKKNTTTSSPSSVRTAPAPFSGKKTTPSHNSSKTASPPPASGGKITNPLINALKTASPPAPSKVSTSQATTTTPSTTSPAFTTSTTTPPVSSARSDPASQFGRTLTPQPSTVTVKVNIHSTEVENSTTSAPEIPPPEINITLTELPPPLTTPTPAPAPILDENSTNSETDLGIPTIVSATFAPMPGVTDGPRLWEAAGLLGRLYVLLCLLFACLKS